VVLAPAIPWHSDAHISLIYACVEGIEPIKIRMMPQKNAKVYGRGINHRDRLGALGPLVEPVVALG
jgi:hypothetical protein